MDQKSTAIDPYGSPWTHECCVDPRSPPEALAGLVQQPPSVARAEEGRVWGMASAAGTEGKPAEQVRACARALSLLSLSLSL